MITPDWLQQRGGILKPGLCPETTFVLLDGKPLYKLEVRPAAGKITCTVSLTNNGRRLDNAKMVYSDASSAINGGLEQLRTVLGW